MDKFTKILIVVVIILVAGLGLTVGLLIGNNLNKPSMINNTTNSTNSSAQTNQTNSTNLNQTSSTKSKYISESQAIRLAKAAWPVPGATYYVSSYPTSASPYYWVTCHVKGSVGPDGNIKINAINGEVLEKFT